MNGKTPDEPMSLDALPVVLLPGFMLDETLRDDFSADFPPQRTFIRASLTRGDSIAAPANYRRALSCPDSPSWAIWRWQLRSAHGWTNTRLVVPVTEDEPVCGEGVSVGTGINPAQRCDRRAK